MVHKHIVIENFDTGIPRKLDLYVKEERKPLFEVIDNFFYVTLPNLNYTGDNQINNFDLSILQANYDNPGIKVPSIHDKLLNDYPTVTLDQIRNSIKRKISKYVEYQGSVLLPL